MGNNITLQGNLDPTLLYAEEVRILYYQTSHKFAMLKLHMPEGENSYYQPAIISTITCAYSLFI